MGALVSAFAIATLYGEFSPVLREFKPPTRLLRQTGDSSLSPSSVNWLAATAFAGAVLICFVFV